MLPIAPPVFAHWRGVEALADRLGPVRLVLSGSAPLAAEVIEEFTAITAIPVHQGYGLTEAAPVVTSTLCSEKQQFGSVGAALPGIATAPRRREPGAPCLWARTRARSRSRAPTSSAATGPTASGGPDAEGWWSTGDVGFLDLDGRPLPRRPGQGLVIVSGFNVDPSRSRTSSARCRVSATLPSSGSRTTRTARRWWRRRGANNSSTRLMGPRDLPEAVRDHAASRLARFKQPTRIEVVAELPPTVTCKVQKGRLRGDGAPARAGPARVNTPSRHALRPGRAAICATMPGCHRGRLRRAGGVVQRGRRRHRRGLSQRFSDEVPVTFVDGRQHDFWWVHPQRLRAALRAGPAHPC